MKKAIESPFAKQPSRYLADRTILQIIPSLEAGGAERTTVDLAEGLAARGARALVATEGGRLIPELQAKGGIWLPFPAATKNPVVISPACIAGKRNSNVLSILGAIPASS